MKIKVNFDDEEWDSFHDVLHGLSGMFFSRKELEREFKALPNVIIGAAISFGLSDVEVRESIREHFRGN